MLLSHSVALDTMFLSRVVELTEVIMSKRYHKYLEDGSGNVYYKNGSFHLRWWTEENGKRRQRSQKLCDKQARDETRRSKRVLDLARDRMAELRASATPQESAPSSVTVVEFFERTYLPLQEANRRKPSTMYALNQIWNQHLKGHFGQTSLTDYKKVTATNFLTELSKKYSKNTVSHVKATASGMFKIASAMELIPANPWKEAKSLVNARKTDETEDYSLEELEAIVTLLIDSPQLQLTVCLAGLAGLRNGEIATLKWEDFTERDGWVRVQRNLSRGEVVDSPKTDSSNREVPLIKPVKLALEAWRAKCGKVTEGWVFPGRWADSPGAPATRERKLQDLLAKEKLAWKGLHAFRRSAATILTQLTNDPLAAAQMLGHKDTKITMEAYIKLRNREVLAAAMKLLEAKVLASGKEEDTSSK